jgi:hypothetical protein
MIQECYRLIQRVSIKLYPVCVWPGCNQPSVVGHHIFKRDKMATAFHPDCVLGMCNNHHDSAHRYRKCFKGILMVRMGDERYYELLRLSNAVVKNIDFKEVRDNLKELL